MGRLSISGAAIFDLAWENGRLAALSENDQLLRRFGQVDVVKLVPDRPLENYRKGSADEIWLLLEGSAEVVLTDRRAESPTQGDVETLTLNGETPQLVLIPFGTAAAIKSSTAGMLLRITSHADDDFPDDLIWQAGK